MALFNKPDNSRITVSNGWVTIHNGVDKSKDSRGDVVVPAGAIQRVTSDTDFVRIHVDGVPHPAPKAIDSVSHNRYAVSYIRAKTAAAVVAEVEAAMEAVRGVPVPEDWVAAPQSPKAVEQAAKKSYEMWEADRAAKRQRAEEVRKAAEKALADRQAAMDAVMPQRTGAAPVPESSFQEIMEQKNQAKSVDSYDPRAAAQGQVLGSGVPPFR